jgi:hypothetical protein
VAKATEELAKAACLEVEQWSSIIGRDTLERLQQSISKLEEGMTKLNEQIAHQSKDYKLRWAIDRLQKGISRNSDTLLLPVLYSFLRGTGHRIHYEEIPMYFQSSSCDHESVKRSINESFIEGLHRMMGHEPKLVEVNDHSYLYYS